MKRDYLPPIITLTQVVSENSLASSSANAEFLFQGQSNSTPEMEDWTDNSSNLGEFTQEKWF